MLSDVLLWNGCVVTCRGMGFDLLLWDGCAVTCRGMGSDALLWDAVQLLGMHVLVQRLLFEQRDMLIVHDCTWSCACYQQAHGYAASGRYLMCAV